MQGSPITYLERQMIEIRLKGHRGIRNIALDLHRNHGVISREIKRNKEPNGSYSAVRAQMKAEERQRRNMDRRCKLDEDPVLRAHVIAQLKAGYKPHVIAGRLKMHPSLDMEGRYVCHETIFQWIYGGKGRYEHLYPYLSFSQRKRKKRGTGRRGCGIPGRVSIHKRPSSIEKRAEYGHWESDSVLFERGQRPRLSVQYERKAKYVMIHRLSNGSAMETEEALTKSILSLPSTLWKSITFDNGKEGMHHGNLRRSFHLKTYFCDPYASYQKGGVEHVNRLIRRFLPRNTDMTHITQADIYAIQERINTTPRRSLDYKTPKEVLAEALLGREVVH